MRKMILILFFAFLSQTFAGAPIKIGTSKLNTATGFNNSRKIARTMSDKRVIVYQNIADGSNAIFCTFSVNGDEWSEPKFLDYGYSPAIAVSESDSFYVSYTKSNKNIIKLMVFTFDDLPDLHNAFDIDIYYGSPGAQHASPTLDVGPRFVHLAFQSTNVGGAKSAIRYGLFHRNLEPATSIFTLNSAEVSATQPTLQTDLEYASDYVNIFWNEEKDSQMSIHHLSLDADSLYTLQPASENEFWQLLASGLAHINDTFAQLKGCVNPSVSIRTEQVKDEYANRIILGCDNITKKQFNLFSLDYETDVHSIDIRGGYKLSSGQLAWPSVDDIILNPRSCAVVWENSNTIFYGQSLYADIVTETPVDVSEMENSHYPSVCYKSFRSDVFDVVWTEGLPSDSVFQIYYRRMDKQYWFDPIVIGIDSIVTGTYLHALDIPIHVTGGINSKLDLSLVKGQLPDSLRFARSDTDDNVWRLFGVPQISGDIPLTFRAVDVGDDVGLSEEKTIRLEIQNTAPIITVESTSDVWRVGDVVSYTISIHDDEDNSFEWNVHSLPVGLTLNKADGLITGVATLPPNAVLPYDAVFQFIASDGDKSRTVDVEYHLDYPVSVSMDELDALPKTLTLHPTYPNPFNPETTVKIEVPEQQRIVVEVCDVRGRLVTTLHNGDLPAGFHNFTFDGARISSGSYFIRMQAGEKIQTQKCLLLK